MPTRPPAIVVMAKTPVPDRVKTRLQAEVGPVVAVEVARAILRDTVDNALAVTDHVIVATAGDLPAMADLVPAGIAVHPQRGDDLAERLTHAQHTAFADGADAVLLLGADCPTVDPPLLRTALAALATADAVLGPAVDGGYTLLATSRPTPELFAGITMGRPDVAARTRAEASRHGVVLVEVAPRHDLDVLADLAAALAVGQLAAAPRTRALVAEVLAGTG